MLESHDLQWYDEGPGDSNHDILLGGGAPSDKNLGQAVTKCRNVGSGLNQIQLRVALAGDSKLLGKVMQHNKPEVLHDILIAASRRLRIQPTLPISR